MITYEPFYKTLQEKGFTTYKLINKYNISSATIDKIKKGNRITTMKISDLCNILCCRVEDIIEHFPNNTIDNEFDKTQEKQPPVGQTGGCFFTRLC